MAEKTRRVRFDTMVRYFLQEYDIPARRDLDKIHKKLDRLEKVLKNQSRKNPGRPLIQNGKSATDLVIDAIKKYKNGVRFADVQRDTGFDDKKIRNIIFRLDKLGKIVRVSRGVYVVGPE